jgi:hypothetical protein
MSKTLKKNLYFKSKVSLLLSQKTKFTFFLMRENKASGGDFGCYRVIWIKI